MTVRQFIQEIMKAGTMNPMVLNNEIVGFEIQEKGENDIVKKIDIQTILSKKDRAYGVLTPEEKEQIMVYHAIISEPEF